MNAEGMKVGEYYVSRNSRYIIQVKSLTPSNIVVTWWTYPAFPLVHSGTVTYPVVTEGSNVSWIYTVPWDPLSEDKAFMLISLLQSKK